MRIYALTAYALALAVSLAHAAPVFKGSLAGAYGKDADAFEKALGTKLKRKVEESPEAVPGKSYSDEEMAALPKKKSYSWRGKAPGIGDVYLRRDEKDKGIVFSDFTFESRKVATYQAALAKLGIPAKGVKAKRDGDGGYAFTLALGGKKWQGWFIAKNPDLGNRPNLMVSRG